MPAKFSSWYSTASKAGATIFDQHRPMSPDMIACADRRLSLFERLNLQYGDNTLVQAASLGVRKQAKIAKEIETSRRNSWRTKIHIGGQLTLSLLVEVFSMRASSASKPGFCVVSLLLGMRK